MSIEETVERIKEELQAESVEYRRSSQHFHCYIAKAGGGVYRCLVRGNTCFVFRPLGIPVKTIEL